MFLDFMTGGGIINRKSISILLLLLTLALPLNVGAISAATTQTNVYQNIDHNLTTNQNGQSSTLALNATKNSSNTSKIQNTTSKTGNAAAGTVTATTSVSISLSSINDAAKRVQAYIEANHRLPAYVTVSTKQITMPQFLYLLTADLIKINSKSTTPVTLKTVNPPNPGVETVKNGSLNSTQYINMAKSVKSFIDTYGRVPSYARSAQGRFGFGTLVYTYSKILNFYGTNKRLPNYVAISPGITTVKPYVPPTIPEELKPYLEATANCQADSSVIKSLANSITNGLSTAKERATAIFNWVRDHITYSFYYDTRQGALGTYNSRSANCVDTSHLMIALMRAAGNPAKYQHVYAQFSSGTWYGHVIAMVYVGGTWYKADGTSSRNTFGVVNNWNTGTATIKGTYKELPF